MKRMKLFTVALSDAEHEAFKRKAAEYGMTRANLFRHAVNAYTQVLEPFANADRIAIDYATWHYTAIKMSSAQMEIDQMRSDLSEVADEIDAAAGRGWDIDSHVLARLLDSLVELEWRMEVAAHHLDEIRSILLSIDTTRLIELSRLGRVTVDGADSRNPYEDER